MFDSRHEVVSISTTSSGRTDATNRRLVRDNLCMFGSYGTQTYDMGGYVGTSHRYRPISRVAFTTMSSRGIDIAFISMMYIQCITHLHIAYCSTEPYK